jgi:protoporphyrinogen oxidase
VKVAVIAGAGPAGLTAALELLRRSDIRPIVFEADPQVGGISKTVVYRGNRMDLGGHRFFSKSDWVMRWWQDILPLSNGEGQLNPLLALATKDKLESYRTRRFHPSRPIQLC